MTVVAASREAYHTFAAPSLAKSERYLLSLLRQYGPTCNRDLAAIAARPINTITPVIFSLREKGQVVLDHKAKHPLSGITVSYWRAV